MKGIKKNIYFGIFLSVITLQSYAETLNFDDFLNTAIDNSYKLKASKIETQISKKGINEARAGYFPTLSGYAITERYNDLTDGKRPITAVGNEIFLNRDYYQDATAIGLNYNIFDFGIRKRKLEIAKAEDTQKEALLLKNERDLKLDIVDLYAETLNLFKKLKIKEEILNLDEKLLDINTRLRKAGELSEVDVVDSKITISEVESDLIEIKNNLSKKLAEFSYYTNKKYNPDDFNISDFPKINANEDTNTVNVSDKKYNELSIEKNEFKEVGDINLDDSLEAKSYDLEILKKKKEYEIQKRANLPKLSFDTRYNFYGSDASNYLNSFSDLSQRSLSFRISTSFTVFDGLKNVNTVQKKKMEIEKLEVEKQEELAQLKKKYDQIQLDAKNSLEQAENNEKTLDLVNKNLDNLKRLNENGFIAKANCIKKQLELLEKKEKLEEGKIKANMANYKIVILNESMM